MALRCAVVGKRTVVDGRSDQCFINSQLRTQSSDILWARGHRSVYIFYPDTVPPIDVVSCHVATDKPPPKTSSGLFLATIYNQSQFAERKQVARYWSINTAVTAVPLSAHPSPIEVAVATARQREFTALFSCTCESVKDVC